MDQLNAAITEYFPTMLYNSPNRMVKWADRVQCSDCFIGTGARMTVWKEEDGLMWWEERGGNKQHHRPAK